MSKVSKSDRLLVNVASYFYMGRDGKFYLCEGFTNLPQDVLRDLIAHAETLILSYPEELVGELATGFERTKGRVPSGGL